MSDADRIRPDDPLTGDDIASIPAVYRRTIARYLVERAELVAAGLESRYGPRVRHTQGYRAYVDVVTAAATDIAEPPTTADARPATPVFVKRVVAHLTTDERAERLMPW